MYELEQEQSYRHRSNRRAGGGEYESKRRREGHPLLDLQRQVGNQTMQRMLHTSSGRSGQNSWGARLTAGNAAPAFKTGGDAPVPLRPLTEEDRAVGLQADRFKDDEQLQDAFDNNPPLRMSDTGPAVKKLQQALLDLGYAMPKSTGLYDEPDGIFGQETYQIVKGFQWQQGIVRDGIVGRQTMGELDGRFSGQSPPGTRASGPDVPGEDVTVSEVERSPRKFSKCGGFTWGVDWKTNARNGYLVQEIVKEMDVKECGGGAVDAAYTPHFWEAWRVQVDGGIHGAAGADDDWIVPSYDTSHLPGGSATKGSWKITGRVFFVNQLDPAAGFKATGHVPDAGSLWATTTEPGNLGKVLLLREASDRWNCCAGEEGKMSETEEDEIPKEI